MGNEREARDAKMRQTVLTFGGLTAVEPKLCRSLTFASPPSAGLLSFRSRSYATRRNDVMTFGTAELRKRRNQRASASAKPG
jgi:hypothetical protein